MDANTIGPEDDPTKNWLSEHCSARSIIDMSGMLILLRHDVGTRFLSLVLTSIIRHSLMLQTIRQLSTTEEAMRGGLC